MNKITKIALVIGLSVPFYNQAFAKDTLVVWEDVGKSHGIKQAIEAFEKENNCEVVLSNSEYVGHIGKAEEANEKGEQTPDILMLPADRMGYAAKTGQIKPLAFMQQDKDLYIQGAIDAFTYNGQIYACPRSVETMVVYYNQDLLKFPFESIDDYYNFSKEQRANGKAGVIGKWDVFYFSYGIVSGYGGYVFGKNSDGTLNPEDIGLANDSAVKGLEYVKHFVDTTFPKDIVGDTGWTKIDEMFTKGEAAAVITGPWMLETYAKSGINYGVAPLPKLPNGKYMNPFLGFRGYAISKYAKNEALATKFMQFINQPQYALTRYEQIQEIPPIKAVMELPLIKNDDFANAVAEQSLHAEPTPSIPEMSMVWDPINKAFYDAVSGAVPTKQALEDGVAKVKEAIEAAK